MTDRAREIFGNRISRQDYKKARASKEKFIRKYGDDSAYSYPIILQDNPSIGPILGVKDVLLGEPDRNGQYQRPPADFNLEKGLLVGNIRMGFGHYRISMAIASAARALGYQPYWMDLNSYPETTCTKVISAQNDLYSLGSRISQKSKLFNKVVWEPVNYEGFRKLSYNASDQKNAELMAPVFYNVPKRIPVVATHVWPAQAALHAGMKYVVNAIPDNWPMALHLAEGSLHTVQTHSAYIGYRTLNGMRGKEILRPMPEDSILYTGHYIDHELVDNIKKDCKRRIKRMKKGEAMRFLLTIGGAGAQKEIFAAIIRALLPAVREKKAALYVNVGDYPHVWRELLKEIPQLRKVSRTHYNEWEKTCTFCEDALDGRVIGVHAFCHDNIFEAVYVTNLLMRSCDVLVTKPSELAFYPVPKLFIRRIGGHEKWGAIHSAEIGDGTIECEDIPHVLQMIDLFRGDSSLLEGMCENICANKEMGIYDGAYRAVKAAFSLKEK